MIVKTSQLNFEYPPELVATEAGPRGSSRIFQISKQTDNFSEVSWAEFYKLFNTGDLLVINNTKVIKARLLINNKEIFYLKKLSHSRHWQVLTQKIKLKEGKIIELPGNIQAKIIKAGKPAEIEILQDISMEEYFDKYGHVPLPPYILQLRKDHSDRKEDVARYQTIWANQSGSVAAPTASLHFGDEQLKQIKEQGVEIASVTLHVGAGTFLPIDAENINDFKIHSEEYEVSAEVIQKVINAKQRGVRVWACGTTVLRTLETIAEKVINKDISSQKGQTDLFVKPGFKFKVVDGLLTNFHQPESTLLLLVAAFAGQNKSEDEALSKIMSAYKVAMEKKMRLFSYGDLTVVV